MLQCLSYFTILVVLEIENWYNCSAILSSFINSTSNEIKLIFIYFIKKSQDFLFLHVLCMCGKLCQSMNYLIFTRKFLLELVFFFS